MVRQLSRRAVSEQSEPPSVGDFLVRDVRQSDRAEVMEFTANTWDFGDYIEYVFDDWLNDPSGRFLVAEDPHSGRIAAIDKLSFLSPTEAWFEGLRVNPAFRGRGLGAGFQTYMIGEARKLGARTIRFITNITNHQVHRMAYHDGFSMQLVVRFWKWVDNGAEIGEIAETGESKTAPSGPSTTKLRAASPDEAPLLYDWWRRASSHSTRDLLHENWSYKETSADEWTQRAADGCLLVAADAELSEAVPPTVLLRAGRSDTEEIAWVLSAVTALGADWGPLMRGLLRYARQRGVREVNGLLPDTLEVYSGLTKAGFTPDTDDERLCLFALDISG